MENNQAVREALVELINVIEDGHWNDWTEFIEKAKAALQSPVSKTKEDFNDIANGRDADNQELKSKGQWSDTLDQFLIWTENEGYYYEGHANGVCEWSFKDHGVSENRNTEQLLSEYKKQKGLI